MELEKVLATSLVAGDAVSFDRKPGWWTVAEVFADRSGSVDLTLASVEGDELGVWRFEQESFVLRTDPSSIHHQDEFVGMTVAEARTWAGALGWAFRDHSAGGLGLITDDLRQGRINVWTDEAGLVVRAEMS